MNLHQRIDDFLEERANAESDWDEQQSAFTDFVEMELQDQREMCGASVVQEVGGKDYAGDLLSTRLNNACLNAVEKK